MRTSIVLSLLSLMFMLPLASNAATVDTDNWRINVNENGGQLQFTIEPLTSSSAVLDIEVDAPDTDQEQTVTDPIADPEAAAEDSDVAPILQPGQPDSILINEFVSDPVTGDEEWVELYNPGPNDVNLIDWAIVEGSGRRTTLSDYLLAGEYLVIMSPKGSLNNGGDLIELEDSFGNTINSIAYGTWDGATAPTTTDPNSVGRIPGDADTFEVMEPTLGAANEFEPEFEIALVNPDDTATDNGASSDTTTDTTTNTNGQTTTTDTTTSSNTACETATDDGGTSSTTSDSASGDEAVFVDLANIRTLPLETIVVTEGVVSSEPGVLGKQVFYLAGSGVQVYLNSAEFPTLNRGMRVRVTGELREASGELRVKLDDATDIEILSIEDAPAPHDMTTAEVGEATEGWLVRVTGMVAERTSSSFMLEDNEGQARVFIKSTTGIANTVAVGDEVTVTGIVSQTSSGYRLLPRTQDDILPRTETVGDGQSIVALGLTKSGSGTFGGWVLSSLVALALVSMGGAYAMKKKNVWNKKPLTA